MENSIDSLICKWDSTTFLFFSNNIWGDFIYYSHLLPSISALIVTVFIFINTRGNKASSALLFTGVAFTIWSFMDLFLWASDSMSMIMFVWSAMIYFELFVYVGCLYFIYAHINQRFLSFKQELLIFLLFIPLFIFGHTSLNLLGFDLTNCWREATEGPLWQNYIYYLELAIGAWIIVYSIVNYRKTEQISKKREILTIATGITLFLLSFSIGNIIGSIETDWEIGQIGLFGMPIFLVFIGYAIVRFESFRLKVLAAEALFTATFILLFSLLFIRTISNVRIIIIGTLILFSVLGYLLVRNIKREINQRDEIQRLANKLEVANIRLKQVDKLKSEFVSIASHQLRSPITAIAGYASLIREGSYGPLTNKMAEPLDRIEKSARFMAESIEDYLNVSRIESGNMKYHLSDFSLRDEVEHICDDKRAESVKQGLIIIFRTNLKTNATVNADLGKIQQIIHNLINNSLKYTKKGTINVVVHDDVKIKRVYVDIVDTGIGMSQETIHSIFQKFGRGEKASLTNVNGTGLGLFVARRMAEAMGGTISAYSEGEGKGSRFTLELPLVV